MRHSDRHSWGHPQSHLRLAPWPDVSFVADPYIHDTLCRGPAQEKLCISSTGPMASPGFCASNCAPNRSDRARRAFSTGQKAGQEGGGSGQFVGMPEKHAVLGPWERHDGGLVNRRSEVRILLGALTDAGISRAERGRRCCDGEMRRVGFFGARPAVGPVA